MNSLKSELQAFGNKVSRVAIHLDNSDQWLQIDNTLTELAAVIVPIPHFFSQKQIHHMVEIAGVDAVICENIAKDLWLSFGFKEASNYSFAGTLMLREVKDYPQLPENTHKITFTSGTTNEPKGVCLSLQHLQAVGKSLAVISTDIFKVKKHLCILPLSVLLENVAASYAAGQANIEVIIPSLAEIGLSGSSSLDVKKLIGAICHYKPDSLILMPQMLKAIITVLQSQKNTEQVLDLSFLKFIAVGGAVCSKGLLLKAKALNLPVFEGYGISECGSVISLNTDQEQIGNVGKVLPHQKVKISQDGEILTKGQLFVGYLGAEDNHEQWYATGDLGQFDENNNLHIIGRKKNIIINSFGRNLSPDWIEAELLAISEINQVVVYGEGMPYLTAICVTLQSADKLWDKIAKLNDTLPDYARIKEIIIGSETFTVGNGMLTASGKAKHQNIFKHYSYQLQDIYASTKTITSQSI
ncbi:MAG: AMP-binding protein [Alcanivoracaceae bacterium]|nr:AMP-binding protein [Alcanivoracaceae bacterium]